ncbi:MAG: hypothetical protein K0Q66_508 [Chitinophagaceae bacterium]|nr:hypothetical protein [Chitinophagaceae bacterium]
MADNKRPASRPANQTGSQSGDPRAQQLHSEAGGINNPLRRDKSANKKEERKARGSDGRKGR